MKKVIYFILPFFLLALSCSDSTTSVPVSTGVITGTWKIQERILQTNYPGDIDRSANWYMKEANDTLKYQEIYDATSGKMSLTGLKNGKQTLVRESLYQLNDSVLTLRDPLTAVERLKGTVKLTGQTMVTKYTITKLNIDQVLLEVGMDPNLAASDITGILTVTSKR